MCHPVRASRFTQVNLIMKSPAWGGPWGPCAPFLSAQDFSLIVPLIQGLSMYACYYCSNLNLYFNWPTSMEISFIISVPSETSEFQSKRRNVIAYVWEWFTHLNNNFSFFLSHLFSLESFKMLNIWFFNHTWLLNMLLFCSFLQTFHIILTIYSKLSLVPSLCTPKFPHSSKFCLLQ